MDHRHNHHGLGGEDPCGHQHGSPQPTLTLEETAVDACSRKRHAVSRGYFADPYLKYFTQDTTYLNSPLMNRGYWLRVRAVESAINTFVAALPDDQPFQVVSIGAGYDSLFFRWVGLATNTDPEPAAAVPAVGDGEATEHEATAFALSRLSAAGAALRAGRLARFVELDQPEVMQGKAAVIRRHGDIAAMAALQPGDRPNEPIPATADGAPLHPKGNTVYRLAGVELSQAEDVRSLLTAAAPPTEAGSGGPAREVRVLGTNAADTPLLDPALPTIVLAECVLVYMRPAQSTALLEAIAHGVLARAPRLSLFSYDAINPTTPFGKQMIKALEGRGLQLRGIHEFPSTAEHKQRCQVLGFNAASCWTMKELFTQVPATVAKRLQHIEMLDDYDEWCLVQEHYCVSWATRTGPQMPAGAEATHEPAAPLFY